MTAASAGPALTYLGWSGFVLDFPGAAPLFIDPPNDLAIPLDRDIVLLITHGHPEHVKGAATWLRNPARQGTAQIVASPGICRYLKRQSGPDSDHFHASLAGTGLELPGLAIDVFPCIHMPLLPPEKGAAMTRISQVARHPRLALSILASTLRGPLLPGPVLGFRLRPDQGPGILFWGEGMHRGADIEKIRRTAAGLPADILIAAVEPEDEELLPDLIAATGTPLVLPYEAHMPWRRGFGMGWADLDSLSARLEAKDIGTLRAEPGVSLQLPD
jgi:hypothetical protein